MPNSAIAKTALALKRAFPTRNFLLIIAVFIIFTAIIFTSKSPTWVLKTASQNYKLAVAQTDAARALGLGNRKSMPHDSGMIFVYPRPATTCFWMKDMHFALDILWVDNQKRIVYEVPDVAPASYPQTYCTPIVAQYVIELYAGQAARSNLVNGDQLSF